MTVFEVHIIVDVEEDRPGIHHKVSPLQLRQCLQVGHKLIFGAFVEVKLKALALQLHKLLLRLDHDVFLFVELLSHWVEDYHPVVGAWIDIALKHVELVVILIFDVVVWIVDNQIKLVHVRYDVAWDRQKLDSPGGKRLLKQ